MRNYNVYGLGNALVDTEFEVADAFLAEQSIDKGVMTLVDDNTMSSLTSQLTQRYQQGTQCGGGSAANTLVAVARFGGSAFYSCKVGDDATGTYFMEELAELGIDTPPHASRGTGMSGRCIVMVTDDAERTMNTCLGVSSDLSIDDLSPDAIRRSQYLYIEGYLASSPSALATALEAIAIARRAGIPVALTLSDPSMVSAFRTEFDKLLEGGVDLLFCNKEEALIYTNQDRAEDAAAALTEIARKFAITLGSEGSMVFDENQLISVPGEPAVAVDSNGAGDLYAGAFLYAITHGQNYEAAAQWANRSAALLVSKFGARLPAEDHLRLINSMK